MTLSIIQQRDLGRPLLQKQYLGLNFFSGDWEVLDSFIGLSTKIVRLRFEQIPVDLLFDFAVDHFEHSESFVRASAAELLFELLKFEQNLLRTKFNVDKFLCDVFLFETEAIVRRICSKMMIGLESSSPGVRKIMTRALFDLDWEVKEEVSPALTVNHLYSLS